MVQKTNILHRRQRVQFSWQAFLVLCFLFFFLLGILAANGLGRTQLLQYGKMNEYYLGQLAYLDIKREEYLAYLFVGRLSLFGILLLLGCTWLGIPALLLATGWYGFSLGYLFVDALVGMGLKGMLLVVASLFPQAFAYVPGCLWMAKGMMENGNNPLRFLGVHSVPRTVRIRRLLVAGLFLLAGVWLEGTINPIVLKNFIRRLL